MLKASKRNRVVRIPDDKRKEYEALGYTITTMSGELLFEPEDKDKTIAKLKAENEALKAENEQLKAAASADAAKKPAKKAAAKATE